MMLPSSSLIREDPATIRGDGARIAEARMIFGPRKEILDLKDHNKMDIEYDPISYGNNIAFVHDGQIDLSLEGETVYRDEGYLASARGKSLTMCRAMRALLSAGTNGRLALAK